MSLLVFINSGKTLYKGNESSDISLVSSIQIFWIIVSYPIISSITSLISQIVEVI